MRKFLVSGFGRVPGLLAPMPINMIATLEPHECFDAAMVATLQNMLLEQNPECDMARLTGFCALESEPPRQLELVHSVTLDLAAAGGTELPGPRQGMSFLPDRYRTGGYTGQVDVNMAPTRCGQSNFGSHHWSLLELNPADVLPPVDCPLLIELEEGCLVLATRPTFVEHKGDELVFKTENGMTVIGRPRWTYP